MQTGRKEIFILYHAKLLNKNDLFAWRSKRILMPQQLAYTINNFIFSQSHPAGDGS
jgi:hypothetical protein